MVNININWFASISAGLRQYEYGAGVLCMNKM